MARKFQELWDKMSPEAQRLSERYYHEMAAELAREEIGAPGSVTNRVHVGVVHIGGSDEGIQRTP